MITMKKTVKNKDGFTLIEIIVVLVILAILAAASVPAMIGFVEEARGKAYVMDARSGLVAAQAVVTEVVAAGGTVNGNGDLGGGSSVLTHTTFKNMTNDVQGKSTAFTGVEVDTNIYRVTGITYTYGGYTVAITSGSGTTVTKN